MNFFFGFKNDNISCELTIPKFNFEGKKNRQKFQCIFSGNF